MLKIAGALLTVVAVMAVGGVLKLAFLPFRTAFRLLPSRAAA